MKYNYVIFGLPGEFFELQIMELLGLENVVWVPGLMCHMRNPMKFMYRAHTSWKINDHIPLPFKKIWNPHYFKSSFKNDRPICFVFFSSPENYDLGAFGYLEYLRYQYPKCKLVLYFMDLVDAHYARCHGFCLDDIRKNYDLVLVYNKADAEKYGFQYYSGHISKLPVTKSKNYPRSDAIFVGRAKDRLPLLLDVYQKLKENGMQCDFHITDVPKEQQRFPDDIVYNRPMPYREMVQRSVDSRCILEVVQKGAVGFTSRCSEAIMYDKLLITNNPIIFDLKFYNPQWMQYFESADDLDLGFIERNCDTLNHRYAGELSPLKLLELIENFKFAQ